MQETSVPPKFSQNPRDGRIPMNNEIKNTKYTAFKPKSNAQETHLKCIQEIGQLPSAIRAREEARKGVKAAINVTNHQKH